MHLLRVTSPCAWRLLRCRLLSACAKAPEALCEVQTTELGSAGCVAVARVLMPAKHSREALETAAQVAWGRCVAALSGRAPSLAVHFSNDAAASALALTAAAGLFGAAPPPLIGAVAGRWLPISPGQHLVLAAVALPPGVRAHCFEGHTPSLPDLEDLKGSLTIRPPHLLFLSHASFSGAPLNSLATRLDDVLPHSCKAGAVAFTVDAVDVEVDAASVAKEAPISQQIVRGAGGACGVPPRYVGIALALRAKDGAEGVEGAQAAPLSVLDFAALARAVFGSARFRTLWFSSEASRALFQPAGAPHTQGEPAAEALHAARQLAAPGSTHNLPLFALDDVVLLPGGREELMVFEPRYRLMLRQAVEEAHVAAGVPRFGVCSRGVGTLGLLAGRNSLDHGRVHVSVLGGRRFKVSGELDVALDSFGLSRAQVTFFEDQPPADAQALAQRHRAAQSATTQFRAALVEARAAAAASGRVLLHADAALARVEAAACAPGDDGAERLSWVLANMIPAGTRTLRSWLTGTCTQSRLDDISQILTSKRQEVVSDWARTL